MDLLAIVYTSLLIFSIFAVLLISVSFTIYKLKGNKVENHNSDSTFVLRRPAAFSTATTKIVYQKSSDVRMNRNNLPTHYYNQQTQPSANTWNVHKNRVASSQQNSYNNVNSERYHILSNINNSPYGGGGYINNSSQRNFNMSNYYDDRFESKPCHHGNNSRLL